MSDELKAAEKELVRAVSVATEKLELVRKAIAVGESLHTEAKPKRVRRAKAAVKPREAPKYKPSDGTPQVTHSETRVRGRKALFTAEQAANMAQSVKEGTSIKDLATTYHATPQTITRTIARLQNGARA
jgi:hypothetical protein